MTCSSVRTSLSAMSDGQRLREPERATVEQHLAACDDCRCYEREIRTLSQELRSLAPQQPPVELTFRLRVIASHERDRMVRGVDWLSTLRFRLNQILRPLAVPAAGGIFASLLFFAML